MAVDLVKHGLSFAVRFNNHFTGEAVTDELLVRLDESYQRPARRPGGGGFRQTDGAYRFLHVPTGTVRVLWRPPFTRQHAGWIRWDDDPEVVVPRPDASQLVEVELWPGSTAPAPASATGVRGRLVGPDPDGQTVQIAVQGDPFVHFTRSDDTGEFLFLPPGRLPADPTGRVPLTIEVRAPDGSLRAVNGGSFVPDSAGPAFPAADFTITPRAITRTLFRLA